MLHITHGDRANQALQRAGIEGEFLAWSDVLHDGPVPGGLGLEELSRVRAAFIASCGWATDFEAQTHFMSRDALFRRGATGGGIVIWNSFELYDQLHLLQLLNWYQEEGQGLGWPELVSVPAYLGQAQPEQLHRYFDARRPAAEDQMRLAQDAWHVFSGASPRMLANLLDADLAALPFLAPALERLLQEYPGPSGINRSEQQLLQAVEKGVQDPAGLFREVRQQEEVAFMGDASFWMVLERLLAQPCPLLQVSGGRFVRPGLAGCDEAFLALRFELTLAGQAVLAGDEDWLARQPIERWIGGVHLTNDNDWRWDSVRRELLRGV